jgi:hypothetical protein
MKAKEKPLVKPKGADQYFSKVRIARQLLREKSEEILAEYLDIVARARDAGEHEVAVKALQWLIDHMPADEDGDRMVDQSVDKKQETIQQGPVGPAIKIGIAVGGLTQNQKSLPKPSDIVTAEVINE